MVFWLTLAVLTAGLLWYMVAMPGASHSGALAPLNAQEALLAADLRRHVAGIASREHNVFTPSELAASALYIELWREGYAALLVTDTAPYRYPHYHTAQDTPDKVDYERLARVVTGLSGMLRELVDGR